MTKKYQQGKKLSKEHRKKISDGLKGRINWNRGLTKETDSRIMKMSLSKKGTTPWIKGRKHTQESKDKMSKAHKGMKKPWVAVKNRSEKHRKMLKGIWEKRRVDYGKSGCKDVEKLKEKLRGTIPWNKGLTKEGDERVMNISKSLKKNPHAKNPSVRKKMSIKRKEFYKNNPHPRGMLGKKMSLSTRKKKSEIQKRIMSNPEMVRKILGRRGKSALEIKFEILINQLGLPYRFVGNGDVIIARKVPDFVDSNGKRIAIEVYYKKHKEKFRGGLEIWKAERAKIFNENGWKIIFFDETQVNKENIKNILGAQN